MDAPLAGLRVVEMTEGYAGPYAGKLLGLLGAEVVKIESPAGDKTRHEGPVVGDAGPEHETRAAFLHLNTNKRSFVVGGAADHPTLAQLMRAADVVLVDEEVVTGAGVDFDPDELRRLNPGVTVVWVSSFGRTGPYAGYRGEEIVHYAVGGACRPPGWRAGSRSSWPATSGPTRPAAPSPWPPWPAARWPGERERGRWWTCRWSKPS